MQQHPTQSLLGGGHPSVASATTELVQKYLDENNQLILAILDNQNHGKLNECAAFQQKLQSNLMFLAAVADAETQHPPILTQVQPPSLLPLGAQYTMHQQAQQQMTPQSMMVARNSLQFASVAALQQAQLQQQQAMHGQHGAGSNSFQMNPMESLMTVDNLVASRGYAGSGIPEGIQLNRGLSADMCTGNRSDIVVVSDMGRHLGFAGGNAGSGMGKGAGELGPPYLKAANEGDN